MSRPDRFTFMPGDLVEVTRPSDIPPDDEVSWVRDRVEKALMDGTPFNTIDLHREYARRKASARSV